MLGALAIKIIVRYLERGNLQLVSLLSSICVAFQVKYGILPTAGDACWSAELLEKLRACRNIYAEWLFRMGALKARAEILKYEKWASRGGRGRPVFEAKQMSPRGGRGRPFFEAKQISPRAVVAPDSGRSPPKPPPSPIEVEQDHDDNAAGKASRAVAGAASSARTMASFTMEQPNTAATSTSSSPFHTGGAMAGPHREGDGADEFASETIATCDVCRSNFKSHRNSSSGEGENHERGGGENVACRRCHNQPICVICHLPVRGLCRTCPECHHGGHFQHLQKWFQSGENFCPTGCGCRCSSLRQDFEKDM
mmetsp:Transcript_14938/g.20780  ORF Transcript_14938/g.20780 Transcript_14938/m.20780 type:complete len:310 (+) Transcript_14938:3-932(+)